MPELVIFDLDNTLAESKSPLTDQMALLVSQLLDKTRVAVISGGGLPQFLLQVVEKLPPHADVKKLYLLPTAGAALYEYTNDTWSQVYEEKISEDDAKIIEAAVDAGMRASGVIDITAETHGPRYEYRGGSIVFSALGQMAPWEEKKAWDPDHRKRQALVATIQPLLPPGYDIKAGGSTSVDITKAGINKAYGVRKLSEHLSISIANMLYIGDALFPGGNDEVVKESGIKTQAVKDPEETAVLIASLLA